MSTMADHSYDVIMVGGGAVGCCAAYSLMKADNRLKVAIVEMDPSYTYASTPLSDGNIRIQFGLKENIEISQYGMEVLERFAEEMAVDDSRPDVGFRRQGNLFLVGESGRLEAEQSLALQQSLGCQVEWLTPDEVAQRYPLCDPARVVGGTFGSEDGTMDPWALLVGYKNKAISLGAEFIHAEVTALQKTGSRISGVRLSSGDALIAGAVLNSAGAWASRIAQSVGIDLPVQPVRRQVFVVDTNALPDGVLPFMCSPSGLYWIHEQGGQFMCGKSLPDDPIGYDFTWDRSTFIEHLWPELVDFVPSFDRLKVTRGWAGLYAVNTLDQNAILGEWPELKGFYLANGFSGHGLQQVPAVGRYITELILGKPPTLDLSVLSPQRVLDNKPVLETGRSIV
jgi:glycine/D-amino acid oxidase-like deaminating enzyme